MAWLVAAGSVLSSVLNLFGANKEADANTNAENMQMQQFQQTQQNLAPYRQAGSDALMGMQQLSANPNSITSNPAYQFRLQQGENAINASAAARGGYFSGATGQALQNYGQGEASQEYENQYNRLASLASLGQNAATQTGNFGAQATTNAGNYGIGAAQAQTQGLASVGQNVGTLAGTIYQQNQNQDWLNMMNQGNTTASLNSLGGGGYTPQWQNPNQLGNFDFGTYSMQ